MMLSPEELHQRLRSDWVPQSYAEAVSFLYGLTPAGQGLFRGADGFRRSQFYLEALGNPQDKVRAVHVAGTAGKGSICAGIAAALSAHGMKVGLHLSPHVYDIRERIQIDGQLCPAEAFRELLVEALPAIRQTAVSEFGLPTFFEVTVGMAFQWFAKQACNAVVVETGLGGLYDTTNAISRRDKLAVISHLGLDHQTVLGNTIEEIAAQKAGILRGEYAVAAYPAESSVRAILTEAAAAHGCHLEMMQPDGRLSEVSHLAENMTVILAATQAFLQQGDRDYQEDLSLAAMATAGLPGRFERVTDASRTLAILDGAHNPLKLSAFCESVRSLYGAQAKFKWVFAARPDKAITDMLKLMAPYAEAILFAEFEIAGGDVAAARSASVEELAAHAAQAGLGAICRPIAPSDLVVTADEPPLLVVGSFYYLSALRQAINLANHVSTRL